jgi:hypothetical protein
MATKWFVPGGPPAVIAQPRPRQLQLLTAGEPIVVVDGVREEQVEVVAIGADHQDVDMAPLRRADPESKRVPADSDS